jgi:hypothetical protein
MWGTWWIFPILGLLFVAFMLAFCVRMMRGTMGSAGMCDRGGHQASEMDDLRREVRELREEIKQLKAPA